MPYLDRDPLNDFVDYYELLATFMYNEFEDAQCSRFDDKKYRFLCIEVKDEPDAHDDWIGVK
jgi:hypothetical protein